MKILFNNTCLSGSHNFYVPDHFSDKSYNRKFFRNPHDCTQRSRITCIIAYLLFFIWHLTVKWQWNLKYKRQIKNILHYFYLFIYLIHFSVKIFTKKSSSRPSLTFPSMFSCFSLFIIDPNKGHFFSKIFYISNI